MSWFRKYCVRRLMDMLESGERIWQQSLRQAFEQGRERFGPEQWAGQTQFEASDPLAPKKEVFFEWLDHQPGTFIFNMKSLIDDFVEELEGFRPLETESRTTNAPIIDADELNRQWGF